MLSCLNFVASGKENPALQVEGTTDAQERGYRGFFLTKIGNSDAVGSVAGKARNRVFVVYYANWNAHPAETADDAETLIVAADYDSARRSAQIKHGALPQNTDGWTNIHAATLPLTEK